MTSYVKLLICLFIERVYSECSINNLNGLSTFGEDLIERAVYYKNYGCFQDDWVEQHKGCVLASELLEIVKFDKMSDDDALRQGLDDLRRL